MSAAHVIFNTFFQNKTFCYEASLQGQYCENNVFFVGDKAGPGRDLSILLHEICHFVELERERLVKFPANGWGLTHGKFWQIGTAWGYEPRTVQQVDREARVWGFQLLAQKHLELNDSAYELVRSAVWLPAFCHYKYSFSGKITDTKALYHLAKRVERLSKRISYDQLVNEFHERVKLLENLR